MQEDGPTPQASEQQTKMWQASTAQRTLHPREHQNNYISGHFLETDCNYTLIGPF